MSMQLKEGWLRFWKEEDGLGTLEILLIIAVLIIIAIAFRKWIVKWMGELFGSADEQIKLERESIRGDGNALSPPKTP
ncbi:Flp1 family type IVb pilin [Paenibacillus puerhi]|uniref:Flp1 family type IVb pilin n=1 Tax=Paenibacillus puerhi TaxID=2692622 RepID=UPI001357859E|nr:Flp1 family type IVb pilin [Paenibacillus puerhi]